jgi:hypothetical protein
MPRTAGSEHPGARQEDKTAVVMLAGRRARRQDWGLQHWEGGSADRRQPLTTKPLMSEGTQGLLCRTVMPLGYV